MGSIEKLRWAASSRVCQGTKLEVDQVCTVRYGSAKFCREWRVISVPAQGGDCDLVKHEGWIEGLRKN